MTVINPIDDNTFGWAAWFNALANAHGAGGIVDGCSISKGTGDWDIDVTSGTIFEGGTQASITSDTVTITDSSGLSSGESRVTLITADTGDALASTDGSAAVAPATPDIPAGEVLLGFVIVTNGDSTVADSDIFDIPALTQSRIRTADPSDVSGSRSSGTWYQNTSSYLLVVSINVSSTAGTITLHLNSSQSNNVFQESYQNTTTGSERDQLLAIVPRDWYYKLEVGSEAFHEWHEYEVRV